MEELTIGTLQGTWLGKEYNLIIGSRNNPNVGRLIDIDNDTLIETKNVQLSELTTENTRMLIFDKDNRIEIWGWYQTEMIIIVNNNKHEIKLRP